MKPLHKAVGHQLLFMNNANSIHAPDPKMPHMLYFSRSALEQLWSTLNDLQDAATEWNDKE